MALVDYIGYELGEQLPLKPTLPTGTSGKVGDPAMFGRAPAVMKTDQDPNTGKTTLKFNGVHKFTVHAVDAAAVAAIAIGDDLFYDPAPGTTSGVPNPTINRDATNGKFFGQATEAITAGGKQDIYVRFI